MIQGQTSCPSMPEPSSNVRERTTIQDNTNSNDNSRRVLPHRELSFKINTILLSHEENMQKIESLEAENISLRQRLAIMQNKLLDRDRKIARMAYICSSMVQEIASEEEDGSRDR